VSDLNAVASLAEPTRAALYHFVAGSARAVGRDDAAAACKVSRQTAAYHLDRLADDGLLDVEFRRLTGLSGPGAGRPAKLYRKSTRSFSVTLPPRRYELAARIMLEAIGLDDPVSATAHRIGEELGRRGLTEALGEVGYEPAEVGDETRFRNCPFHLLKEQDRETTCAMNLALVEGMVEGAGQRDLRPVLAPEDGYCCVRLRSDPGAGTKR
jgi:predicted ArsR family transcriptional regulator